MIRAACSALETAGYDLSPVQALIRAELPPGYRGMSWENGAALGSEAFASQGVLNHVLEEEYLHLRQRASGAMAAFEQGTAKSLEEEVDAIRKFRLPDS